MATIGSRLRAARVAGGLSQDALADRLGVSKTTVSSWERDIDRPRVDVLPTLREALGLSLDHLICGDSDLNRWQRQAAMVRDGAPLSYVIHDSDAVAKTAEEVRLLAKLRSMSERQRRALLEFLGMH